MNFEIIVVLILIILISAEIILRIFRRTTNVVKGRLILYPGQQTKPEKMRISVFRFGSRKPPELVPVNEKLEFEIKFFVDGEYDISAIVINDDCFDSKSLRVQVESGKVISEKKIKLEFRYGNYD